MITITNNDVYRSDFSIVNIQDINDIDIIPDDEIINYLSDEVELGESITFERIFDLIKINRDILSNVYYSCLGGYSLSPFLEEIDDIPSENVNLKYLEVYWIFDKNGDDVDSISAFHGIGNEETDEGIAKKGDEISYALDFVSLNNLKYLNIKLNRELILLDYNDKKMKRNNLGNKRFTLFDFLYAILFEISFNGDPDGRKDRLNELEEQTIVNREEYESGNLDDIDNLDDLISYFESNDDFLVKYKKLRERVDEELSAGLDLEPLKNCLIEKLKIYDEIQETDKGDLTKYDKKLSDVEFNMQILYGLDENESQHRFWETPKCTCPKIDNIVNFPRGNYTISEDCPIHKKRNK